MTVLESQSWEPVIEEQSLSDGQRVFFAYHPELVGIAAEGVNAGEARQGFQENLDWYLRHLDESRLPRPVSTHQRFTIDLSAVDSGSQAYLVAETQVGRTTESLLITS